MFLSHLVCYSWRWHLVRPHPSKQIAYYTDWLVASISAFCAINILCFWTLVSCSSDHFVIFNPFTLEAFFSRRWRTNFKRDFVVVFSFQNFDCPQDWHHNFQARWLALFHVLDKQNKRYYSAFSHYFGPFHTSKNHGIAKLVLLYFGFFAMEQELIWLVHSFTVLLSHPVDDSCLSYQ